jgi:hypothetical protein
MLDFLNPAGLLDKRAGKGLGGCSLGRLGSLAFGGLSFCRGSSAFSRHRDQRRLNCPVFVAGVDLRYGCSRHKHENQGE